MHVTAADSIRGLLLYHYNTFTHFARTQIRSLPFQRNPQFLK